MDCPTAIEDQAETVLAGKACNYKVTGEYPLGATDNEKRSIRRKAKKFEIVDGEVFYIKARGKKV